MLGLSMRLAWRELRAGRLWVLLWALSLAVAATTAVGLVNERLQAALGRQSAELLGGDLVVRSAYPLRPEGLALFEQAGLRQARTLEFASVLIARGASPQMQLAAVKAVSEAYPLFGRIRLGAASTGEAMYVEHGPARGELWLESRLFDQLGIAPGALVELGQRTFMAREVLQLEPDRGGGWYALMPRALMHLDDVADTGLLGPGSRVTWRYLIAADEARIATLKSQLAAVLGEGERLQTPADGRPGISRALQQIEQYLALGVVLTVVLAGVAVALGVRHFSERHFDNCALMRCLGLSQRRVLALLLAELGVIAVAALCLGAVLAALVDVLLLTLLPDWFAVIAVRGLAGAYLGGAATGVLVALGFGMPPLIRLGRVSPLRVLRRELAPLPLAGWLTYLLALTVLVLLLYLFSRSWILTLTIPSVALLLLLCERLLTRQLLYPLLRRLQRPSLPLPFRLTLQRWQRQPALLQVQLLAFALTLMAMSTVLVLRTDLLQRWQAQLPERTPNWFALNIQPAEVDAVAQGLTGAGIEVPPLYPLVRGRLTGIEGRPAREAVPASAREANALRRALNLTVSASLPEGNRLIAGDWWPLPHTLPEGVHPVSVEAGLAARLGLELGSRIEFSIAGQVLRARVVNLREVQWESMRPNFYMIFPPGHLSDYPASWMTSFYLPVAERERLLPVMRQFPSLSFLDLQAVFDQIGALLGRLALAVELLLVLVLLAGIAVLWAGLVASDLERTRELGVLRMLGARRSVLALSQWAEFALLGAVAGLLATVATELLVWLLYRYLFALAYTGSPWLWCLPLFSALVLGLIGRLGYRHLLDKSPGSLLRYL